MKRILKRLSEKADRLASKASEHKNKIVAAGTVALGTAQAQAAITVDVATAMTDMGTAFAAILGVVVLGFGFHKISGMFSGK
jgi:cell division septum initiation protein DivIVA